MTLGFIPPPHHGHHGHHGQHAQNFNMFGPGWWGADATPWRTEYVQVPAATDYTPLYFIGGLALLAVLLGRN